MDKTKRSTNLQNLTPNSQWMQEKLAKADTFFKKRKIQDDAFYGFVILTVKECKGNEYEISSDQVKAYIEADEQYHSLFTKRERAVALISWENAKEIAVDKMRSHPLWSDYSMIMMRLDEIVQERKIDITDIEYKELKTQMAFIFQLNSRGALIRIPHVIANISAANHNFKPI